MGVWFLISITLPLFNGGINNEFITRLLVLAYLLASLFWFYKKGRFMTVVNPKKTFIIWAVINAMFVEIFHMISNPLNMSLLITSSTSFADAIKFTSIDLILTFPAYIIIFSVMWQFIKRYDYSPFAFFLIMSLGQALGDGNAFFILNPLLLILVPYVMVNYWAMNFVPYLVIRSSVAREAGPVSKFKKYVLPVIVIPLTYLVAAGIILTIGGVLGWIPK